MHCGGRAFYHPAPLREAGHIGSPRFFSWALPCRTGVQNLKSPGHYQAPVRSDGHIGTGGIRDYGRLWFKKTIKALRPQSGFQLFVPSPELTIHVPCQCDIRRVLLVRAFAEPIRFYPGDGDKRCSRQR